VARRDPFDRPREDARGVGVEAAVYRDRARRLGLSFVPFVDLGRNALSDIAAIHSATFAMSSDGRRLAYLAPDDDAVPAILRWLAAHPAARARLKVSTPSAIRTALVAARQERLAADAVSRLSSVHPCFSARRVVSVGQALAALLIAVILIGGASVAPLATIVAANLVGAVLFFGVTALRFVAAGYAARRPPPIADIGRTAFAASDLPVYSVLVPLLDEADLVPGLVRALSRIDWPNERLDVKLLLEAADRATIAAARHAVRGTSFEILIVPPIGPRTKPKALAFALPLCRGAFVTVYDAEDRPHPGQLREAFSTFSKSPPEIACLQSAIVVDNQHPNWLSRMFAVEYAALFDAVLPVLAALGMPLPLGGTSNHFRRAALEDAGGWDPYNVTEDADLGLRLARFGYRSGTLDLPTLEEAPTTFGDWLKQRSRWSKGWMQTWLVHTRSPLRLVRELGARGFLGFNLISTGLIVSSLVYPIYLLLLLVAAVDPLRLWSDGGSLAAILTGVSLFNLAAGYFAMAILGQRALRLRGREREAAALALLPVYWLMTSVASYRALAQLFIRPHHWEKTPHRVPGP